LRSVLVNGRLRSMLFVVTAKPIRSEELGVGGMGEAWPSPKYLSCCWDQLEEEEDVVVVVEAWRLDCGGVGGRWCDDLAAAAEGAAAVAVVTLAGVCGDAGGVGDPGETP
jgi:hypothetical protein